MTLIINLNSEIESRLKSAAARHGLKPEAYATQILEQNLIPADGTASHQATLDLLARWDGEDATSDPTEIASRRKEVETLKDALNENRLRSEGTGARKLFP